MWDAGRDAARGVGAVEVVRDRSQLVRAEASVCVPVHDVLLVPLGDVRPGLRTAEAQHGDGEGVPRQAEQLGVGLGLLHDVADVARADAERLGRDDGVLRGDEGVAAGEQQVADARGDPVRHAVHLVDPGDREQVHPLLVVGDEEEDPGRAGDERLVVAGDGEPVLEHLVVDLDDGVQHHVAGRGRAHGGMEDRALLVVGERRRVVGARRTARVHESMSGSRSESRLAPIRRARRWGRASPGRPGPERSRPRSRCRRACLRRRCRP